jgi:phage terminase small subunit
LALTPKQQRFVDEYQIDLNATQAAVRAGYSRHTAEQQGCRLLRNAQIQQSVADAKEGAREKTGITAQRVKEELARLAFVDMRAFFDEQGNLKPIHQMTADQGAALAGLEVIVKNAQAGDGHTDIVHKFKVWDKCKALELLGKHFGLFDEHAHVSGTIELVWGSGLSRG